MKLSCGLLLLLGSLVGIVLSFISKIVINSPLAAFDGMEISMILGLFFGLTFIGSIFLLFSST